MNKFAPHLLAAIVLISGCTTGPSFRETDQTTPPR